VLTFCVSIFLQKEIIVINYRSKRSVDNDTEVVGQTRSEPNEGSGSDEKFISERNGIITPKNDVDYRFQFHQHFTSNFFV